MQSQQSIKTAKISHIRVVAIWLYLYIGLSSL